MDNEEKIIIEGTEIKSLEEACNWLREAWMFEPYNIYYEDDGYGGCIEIEPTRGNPDATGWSIYSLKEFEEFIRSN